MTAYDEMYNRIYAATLGGLVAARAADTMLGASALAEEAERLTVAAVLHWNRTEGQRQREGERSEGRRADLADLTKRVEALEREREEKRAS